MQRTKTRIFLILWIISILFFVIFYVVPLFSIFQKAFGAFEGNILLGNWKEKIISSLGFTVYQAVLSVIITMLVSFPIIYTFSHFDFKGRKFFHTVVTLPFILPTVVVAAAFNSLLGSNGSLNLFLMHLFSLEMPPIQIANSLTIILLAHVFYNTSVLVRIVETAWMQQEVELEQAARTLGANSRQRFRLVTLPLLKPAIRSAILLVFLFDFTSFGVILLLGGPTFSTLEVEIYLQTTQMLNLPMAGMLSLLQIAITFLISWLLLREPRTGSVTFLPDIKQERLIKPTSRKHKIYLFLLLVFLVLFFILPEISLFLRSLTTIDENGALKPTLRFYKELFQNKHGALFYISPFTALRNSLLYACITVCIAGILGTIIAYVLVHRYKSKVLRLMMILPLGTSSVILGLGFLLTFPHLALFQKVPQSLVPIAHTIVALPMVINTLYPSFLSIPENLREAAANLGATPLQILKKIDLPLIIPPLAVSAIYAFLLSLGEFGATSFLIRPEYPTMPIAIYRYINLPGALNYGQAMAMASLLVCVCALSMFIIENLFLKAKHA